MARITRLLLALLLVSPHHAWAQQATAQPENRQPPASQAEPVVDVSKLGVSLSRIRRELAQAESASQVGQHPKIEYVVEVFGQAPKIDLLRDFPLVGPTPFGAPTHADVLQALTPQAFRTPAFPVSALAIWAAQKAWNRTKKARCEEEIAQYKAQVMAGIAVAAPRCTQ